MLPSIADPAEPGAQHFRGAEQLRVSRYENNEGSAGFIEVRAMRRLLIGLELLRGGKLMPTKANWLFVPVKSGSPGTAERFSFIFATAINFNFTGNGGNIVDCNLCLCLKFSFRGL